MNIYQLLEEIMEALADGRQEGESTEDYRDRKAAELKKLYTDRKEEARALERAYGKQAKKAKREYKRTPNEENVQKWAEMQGKATDMAFKEGDAQTKEFKVDKIKNKIDWRKQMSEALEILEDIYSAIDKKYPKNSERNKELKDSAYKAKAGAEEVAKQHELGKRPESAPIKGGWDIMSVEIPDETPEEKEYAKKEWKYDLKQMKKDITKNKAGEHDTKKKQFPKSYKDVGTLGEPDAKELETERVARKAAGKRKAKMNKNEALELMKEILNVLDEDVYSAIRKKHGEPEYDDLHYTGPNKSYELMSNAQKAKYYEFKGAAKREAKSEEDIASKRKETRNSKGMSKTKDRSKGAIDPFDNDKINWSNYTNNDKVKKSIARHNKKVQEAFSLMEEICSQYNNLFELDYEEKQNISPNKISKVRKDKDGEKVEVVSVADELFPYEGSAKEQFNKKVLDKINAMIEGNGSLEDLIQFVRAGAKAKKVANEAIQEAEPNKECEYRKAKWEEASKKFDDIQAKNTDYAVEKPETRKAYDEERKAYADLDKARRDAKKVHGPYESCEELLENLINEFLGFGEKKKDPAKSTSIAKELRGRQSIYNQHVDTIEKNMKRAEGASGYRKQVLLQNADDAEKKAREASKKLRHAKSEVLDGLRKRGASNPQAHKILSRIMDEGLEELLQTIEGLYTNEAKNIFGKETDRGSLEDDISTTVTGKTLNQHIEGAVKKVTEPKKEA